ncbi:hypothetical protein HK105_200522 [Polyrhizophydium stewartii]|uniref:DDHD domain-containing protein n=1 Tax=Polyrhizophydium stewartii TaxID=2732419 RepID=A0ABR4NJ89_9FUNG|nr:hypothetical protein HK105_002991 [Polyrhizophydium stewartii]
MTDPADAAAVAPDAALDADVEDAEDAQTDTLHAADDDLPPGASSPCGHRVDHVCFVIHGMGQQWEGMGRFHENLAALRKSCKETALEEFGDSSLNIKWIGVEWYSLLHGLDTVDKRMKTITLPTCSVMRHINNNILADVLYYFTSYHGQTLLNIVAKVLNEAYDRFIKAHPYFTGKVALVGHSLGGIICYDLLAHQPGAPLMERRKARAGAAAHAEPDAADRESHATATTPAVHDAPDGPASPAPPAPPQDTHFEIVYPRLHFKPNFLFSLGSPLAAVLVMRGQSFQTYRLHSDIKYFNIFHLYDPLAYRIEPLLDKRYIEISPVLLQRPSSNRSFQFSYYQEIVKAYVPDLSAITSGMTLPSLPSLPSLPTMPAITTMPGMPTIPSLAGMSLPNVSFSSLGIPMPTLPTMPTLGRATESLQSRLSSLYESVVSNFAGEDEVAAGVQKRKRRVSAAAGTTSDRSSAYETDRTDPGRSGDEARSERNGGSATDGDGSVVGEGGDRDDDEAMESPPRKRRGVKASAPRSAEANNGADAQRRHSTDNGSTAAAATSSFSSAVGDIAGMLRRSLLSMPSATSIAAAAAAAPPPPPASAAPESADARPPLPRQPAPRTSSLRKISMRRGGSGSSAPSREEVISEVKDLGEKLTAQLVAAAAEAQRTLELETSSVEGDGDGSDGDDDAEGIDDGSLASASDGEPDAEAGPDADETSSTMVAKPRRRGTPRSRTRHRAGERGETPTARKTTPAERLDYFVQESVIENTVHQYFVGMKAHFSYWNSKDMMHYILSQLKGK